jgi:hypothetical protein
MYNMESSQQHVRSGVTGRDPETTTWRATLCSKSFRKIYDLGDVLEFPVVAENSKHRGGGIYQGVTCI